MEKLGLEDTVPQARWKVDRVVESGASAGPEQQMEAGISARGHTHKTPSTDVDVKCWPSPCSRPDAHHQLKPYWKDQSHRPLLKLRSARQPVIGGSGRRIVSIHPLPVSTYIFHHNLFRFMPIFSSVHISFLIDGHVMQVRDT